MVRKAWLLALGGNMEKFKELKTYPCPQGGCNPLEKLSWIYITAIQIHVVTARPFVLGAPLFPGKGPCLSAELLVCEDNPSELFLKMDWECGKDKAGGRWGRGGN